MMIMDHCSSFWLTIEKLETVFACGSILWYSGDRSDTKTLIVVVVVVAQSIS